MHAQVLVSAAASPSHAVVEFASLLHCLHGAQAVPLPKKPALHAQRTVSLPLPAAHAHVAVALRLQLLHGLQAVPLP